LNGDDRLITMAERAQVTERDRLDPLERRFAAIAA